MYLNAGFNLFKYIKHNVVSTMPSLLKYAEINLKLNCVTISLTICNKMMY